MSDFNKIKNLSSLEFNDVENLDLGLINATIKNLKLSANSNENGKIKIKFSLLNNLETLILFNKSNLDIYDLPNNNDDIYELRNLKYLYLSQGELSQKLNIKVIIPNLIYFYLSIENDETLVDDPCEEEIDFEWSQCWEENLREMINERFKDDINSYFGKFTNLKYLYLNFYVMQSNNGDGLTKKFICKKLENEIFKCNYLYDWTYRITLNELFYYNQKMNKKYNIKLI